jgi:hypothetical protein
MYQGSLQSRMIPMSSHDMRRELERLMAERDAANRAGLSDDGVYMTELDDELAAARDAYVGLAVTEIASLRGELSGRQLG